MRLRLVLPCLLLLAACDKPSTSSSTPPPPSASALSAASTRPVASAAPPASSAPAPTVTEAAARDVLKRWLATQNDGDFAAYKALYAERFEGIRRSGEQVKKLDRASWMRERERMFKNKMAVSADAAQVQVSLGGAEVRFTQTWESAGYKDSGPKVLALISRRSGLRIAREEMLSSTKAKPALPPALHDDRFAYAVGGALVLDDAPKDEWSHAPTAIVSREGAGGAAIVTRREVDEARLPAAVTALKGKKAQLFTATGAACEAKVKGFAVISRVVPHFGIVEQWTATGEHAGEPRPTDAQIAEDAWEQASEGRLLVAELDGDAARCKPATWGRVSHAAAPIFIAAVPADDALKAAAHAELRKLAAYAEAQKEFESESGEPKPSGAWDKTDGTTLEVRQIPLPKGGMLVTAYLHATTGCPFDRTVSAVWEAKGNGTHLVLMSPPSLEQTEIVPTGAADVDGDGTFELLLPDGILQRAGTQYSDFHQLVVPNRDCPC